MSEWQNLVPASFGGVIFHVASTDDSLGRRFATYEFPYRQGAELEDLGRRARTTRVSAVFIGDGYLGRLDALIRVIDAGEAEQFTHPLLGTWTARASLDTIRHEHGRRDMATVDIEFTEDGLDAEPPKIKTTGTLKEEMTEHASAADAAAAALPAAPNSAGVTAATDDATDAARQMVANVESDSGTADVFGDRVRQKSSDAISVARQNYDDVTAYDLTLSLQLVAYTAKLLAEAVISDKPPIRGHEVVGDISVSMLAHILYGDFTRGDEILEMNDIEDPNLVRAGTILKVFTE